MIDLIVISSENDFPDEINQVKSMMQEGLRRFHLRKPNLSAEAFISYINQFDAYEKALIVVHQFHEEAMSQGVHQLHLKSKIRASTPPGAFEKYTSTSFHAWSELEQYGANFKYTFLSPVFESISKPGYRSVENFSTQPLGKNQNVYALGGIIPSRLKLLNGSGFKGVAALGYIWQGQPLDNYRKLHQLCCAHTF